MNFSLTEVLILLVIFQLFFISIFLFSHDKGKKVSNRLLALFFLSLCLNMIDSILLLKRIYLNYPSWAVWGTGIPLLYGPLIYLYVRSLLEPAFAIRKVDSWHFLPFLLLTVTSLISFHTQQTDQQQKILEDIRIRNLPKQVYLVSLVIYFHYFWYMLKSLRLIRDSQKMAPEKFSNERAVNLNWLRSSILFFMVLMCLSAMAGLASVGRWTTIYYLFFALLLGGFIFFLIQILLKALRNPYLFGGQAGTEETKMATVNPTRYAGSALTEAEKAHWKEVLVKHMETTKPYLDPDLSLDQLSAQIGIKPKACSQVINELLGVNFFELVNQYRIEEAKRLLTDPPDPKMTVLEVLYEVGFNSKSSFNTLFKKQTGLTPSEFKKQVRSSSRNQKVEPNK